MNFRRIYSHAVTLHYQKVCFAHAYAEVGAHTTAKNQPKPQNYYLQGHKTTSVYVNAGNGIRERNHNMHSSSAFATGIEWEENSPSSYIRIQRVNERIVVVQKWKSRHLLFGSWLVFNLLLPRFISFSPSSALSWPSAPAYIVCSKLRHLSLSLFVNRHPRKRDGRRLIILFTADRCGSRFTRSPSPHRTARAHAQTLS